jgi:hypothetical protein
VLHSQPELKGQWLVLAVDWDSMKVIKETRYKIYTALTQGTIKFLSDPEKRPKGEGGGPLVSPSSSESDVNGGDTMDNLSETQGH